MADSIVKHVVVDSAGFIRNAPIKDIGENIYTIQDVVSEIRDKATRQRLQVLPYKLVFKDPSAECLTAVTEFSKKTGDYRTLSLIDLKLMALTYQLEKQCSGTEHIRTQPKTNVTWLSTKRHLEKPTEIAGFYIGQKKTPSSSRTTSESVGSVPSEVADLHVCESQDNTENVHMEEISSQNTSESVSEDVSLANSLECSKEESQSEHRTAQVEVVDRDVTVNPIGLDSEALFNQNTVSESCDETSANQEKGIMQEGETLPKDCIMGEEDSSGEDDDDEEDDDDGWITPSNIAAARKAMGQDEGTTKAAVQVGCLTADFSMQNVLIQMGLNVISVDGMLIKRAKSYVLRCSACMKVTTNMMKEFCPVCGNKTLHRVSMSVDDDGQIQYFLSRRRQPTTRGLKYSLPMPRGGKHANNPILSEDQRLPHQRMAKNSKVKYDVFDPSYIASLSPFAPIDTHSRSALLGVRNHTHNFQKRRNPNENKKVYGRRK